MVSSTKSNMQKMTARVNAKQAFTHNSYGQPSGHHTAIYDENGRKKVGTFISDGPYGESRHTRRHPFRVNCTLHTKKWTKARVNHYAKVFGDAVKMKASKTPMEKKSFVRSLVNLFA